MEQDAEVKGFGNHYTTQFRQYDPRLGRWFSPDPIHHPWQSPYSAMDCNPVGYTDPYGLSTGNGPGDKEGREKLTGPDWSWEPENDMRTTLTNDDGVTGEWLGDGWYLVEDSNNESKQTDTPPTPEENGPSQGIKGEENTKPSKLIVGDTHEIEGDGWGAQLDQALEETKPIREGADVAGNTLDVATAPIAIEQGLLSGARFDSRFNTGAPNSHITLGGIKVLNPKYLQHKFEVKVSTNPYAFTRSGVKVPQDRILATKVLKSGNRLSAVMTKNGIIRRIIVNRTAYSTGMNTPISTGGALTYSLLKGAGQVGNAINIGMAGYDWLVFANDPTFDNGLGAGYSTLKATAGVYFPPSGLAFVMGEGIYQNAPAMGRLMYHDAIRIRNAVSSWFE